MSAEFQTRTEFSRSVEDAEMYRALQTLQEVGLLIPVTEVETYHGRVGRAEDVADWAVDPSFANGSNDSGNNNINHRPTLYTGEKQVAEDFAQERGRDTVFAAYKKTFSDRVRKYSPEERQEWLGRLNADERERWEKSSPDQPYPKWTPEPVVHTEAELDDDWTIRKEARKVEDATSEEDKEALASSISQQYRAEIHEIVTGDADATVLDFGFDVSKLDDDSRAKYLQALKALAIPVTEGSPLGFEDRDAIQPFVTAMRKLNKSIVSQEEIPALAAEAGINEDTALQLASAFNARQAVQTSPAYLVSEMLNKPGEIIVNEVEVNGHKEPVPLNLEYVQRYLRNAHIVGVRQSISSATLDRAIISVSFFDLEKTITAEGLTAERQTTWKKLGEMATSLDGVVRTEVVSDQPLLKLLEDAHATPDKLVAAAKAVEGYAEIFGADAGNWEGYSLAEHTETVLRNFDEIFAENVPVQLLAPMRLAILAHDVGKPIAAARGEKHKQKQYNIAQANDFLSKIGVDNKFKNVLLAVIGDGEELAYQMDIRGAGEKAKNAMQELAVDTLKKFYETDQIDEQQVEGFIEMCRMLQICDGGAYTSMAITNTGKGRYRNAPSFNSSFAQPVGFGKRTVRLREDGDMAASPDLTPKGNQQSQSRLRISHRGAGRKSPKLST